MIYFVLCLPMLCWSLAPQLLTRLAILTQLACDEWHHRPLVTASQCHVRTAQCTRFDAIYANARSTIGMGQSDGLLTRLQGGPSLSSSTAG